MNTNWFSASYTECRQKFLDLATRTRARVESFDHPLTGPAGEPLATDVAVLGPVDAGAVLIVESGLHGAEGFAGSAVQAAALADPGITALPPGVALILVHAINPFGFAWNRRFNEDNVDLNRHFVDWDNPGELSNTGYERIADLIIPDEPTAEGLARSDRALDPLRAEMGELAFKAALKLGQYTHPRGVFYGGNGPTWSSRMVERIAQTHLAGVRCAGLIDIHTGLGPFGFGECLSGEAPDSDEGRRASAWYGHVAHTKAANTGYAGSKASILDGYRRAAPGAEWTPIGLEFGTRDPKTVQDAVRLDAALYLHGQDEHPEWARVKAAMTNAFNPPDFEWRAAVVTRGLDVVRMGITGASAQVSG